MTADNDIGIRPVSRLNQIRIEFRNNPVIGINKCYVATCRMFDSCITSGSQTSICLMNYLDIGVHHGIGVRDLTTPVGRPIINANDFNTLKSLSQNAIQTLG